MTITLPEHSGKEKVSCVLTTTAIESPTKVKLIKHHKLCFLSIINWKNTSNKKEKELLI